jgi:predicted alpha/beta hydrolase family esterase
VQHVPRPNNSTSVRSNSAVRLARAALHTAYFFSEDLGTRLAERLFTSPRRFPRPDRERAILATARESIIEVTLRAPRWNRMRVPVTTWHWGLGPKVMLVHGWEGRGSQLGAFVEPLVAAGMSVVAFDAPGHGDSPERRLYLPDLADCVADVAAHSGPLHGIVAHSFGASAVLLAHVQHGVRAAHNAMVAPNVLIEDSVRKFADAVGLDEPDRIAFEQRIAQSTGIPISSLQLSRLASHREDALLVFHDRDDREVRFEHGKQLAAMWPDAELRPTIGLGHRRILRDDSVIAQLVEFMRDDAARPVSDLVREVDRQLEHEHQPAS